MPADQVQIGSFIISKVVLDIIAPLIGTIIGGLISYFSIVSSENRKIKQQKQNIIQEQKREAIKIALQWIDPINNAITRVSLQANPYYPNQANTDGWPNLLNQLKKYDVPRHLLVFLPEEAYKKSFAIIRLLDDLRHSVLFIQEPSTEEDRRNFFNTASSILDTLRNNFEELSKMLEDEYRKTFL